MHGKFDFSSWGQAQIKARLAELRCERAAIEAEELALIAALDRYATPISSYGGDGSLTGNSPGAPSSSTGADGTGDGAGGSGSTGAGAFPGEPAKVAFGPGSTATTLAEDAQISSGAARRMVELANGLVALPEITRAFSCGDLSREVVVELVKFATPDSDAELAKKARHWSALEAIRHRRAAVAISRAEAKKISDERYLKLAWNRDRTQVDLRGRFTGEGGAILDAALGRIMAEMKREGVKSPDCDSANCDSANCDSHRCDSEEAGDSGTAGAGTGEAGSQLGHDRAAGAPERVAYPTRLADALIRLAGMRIGKDPDPVRANVSVHVDIDTLMGTPEMARSIPTSAWVTYLLTSSLVLCVTLASR